MWNPRGTTTEENDDDSWEIKAFEEDTSNTNATWPPRSYSCTFCWREFRSAQALGGHMNVHRRERAHLRFPAPPTMSHTFNPSFLFPPQEIVANHHEIVANNQEFVSYDALSFLYSLPNPNPGTAFFPGLPTNPFAHSSSPLLANSPLATNDFQATHQYVRSAIDSSVSNDLNYYNGIQKRDASIEEELDLELRLGCTSPSSSPPYHAN